MSFKARKMLLTKKRVVATRAEMTNCWLMAMINFPIALKSFRKIQKTVVTASRIRKASGISSKLERKRRVHRLRGWARLVNSIQLSRNTIIACGE